MTINYKDITIDSKLHLMIRCILHLFPFLIFFVHFYVVSFDFDPKTAPQKTKLFFGRKDSFSEKNSRVINGNMVFFASQYPIKYFRLDIDELNQNSNNNYIDLKSLQINGNVLKGERLLRAIKYEREMMVGPAGDICRLYLMIPPEFTFPYSTPRILPDYHIVFRINSDLKFCDYSLIVLFIKLVIFCIFQAAIFYQTRHRWKLIIPTGFFGADFITGLILLALTIYYCYLF
jgi:hypothetical protein